MRRELHSCNNFRWIDINHPSREELDQIQHEFLLHPALVQDCLDPAHLPKFEKINNITFAILRIYDVDAEISADTIQSLTRKISVFIGPNFIITVHRLDPDFFQELIHKCFAEIKNSSGGTSDLSITMALVKFLNRGIRTYHIPLEKAEDELEQFESALFDREASTGMFKELHIIRRRLSLMKRILLHSLDVVQRLSPAGELHSPTFQDLRENVSNLIFLSDELLEDTTNLLNLQISLAAQKTNEVVRVLTVFSVFFMPLTFIVGIYGMNFPDMPEFHWVYGHYFAWGLMVIVTIIIGYWFYRKGWLRLD